MTFFATLYEHLRRAIITRHYGAEAAHTERWQAIVRLWIAGAAALYLLAGTLLSALPKGRELPILVYSAAFLTVASFIYGAIRRWPAPSALRRGFSMFNDYVAITFILIVGGEMALPIAVVLLWVAIGTGVRYGSKYLIASNILAVLSLIATMMLTPYWQNNPYMFAAMLLLIALTPAYAQLLVIEARLAHHAATQANLAKSRLLAQASHDLRQPIHAISLFTACLRDSGLAPDERKMVDNIDRSLHSVSRLFRSLLDISTLDSGKIHPRKEAVVMRDLLQDLADQNAEAARWAGVEIRIVRTVLRFCADRSLMTTIVQNLISNALKYAPGGRVVIGCRRRGKTFSLMICDEGTGIPQQDRHRVFEDFYRVSQPGRDIEGVGLGLPIVKRMASLMGLDVSLRSSDAGTRVSIDGLMPTSENPAVSSSPHHPGASPLLQGTRILLVEDDPEVLAATRLLLERWGCIVQSEISAPEGFDECDMIITDYDLDGPVTGVDCISKLRRELGKDVPAVVMTGHDQGHIVEVLSDPNIPVLAKPVRPSELRGVLTAHKLRSADRGA